MSLFDRHFERPGPGVAADEPRKKGVARYWEILTRDFSDLFKAGLLASLAGIPYAVLLVFAVYSRALVPAILGGVVGGAVFMPFYCALHDTVLRTLRDEPGFWWSTYRRVLRENFKLWAGAGVLFGLVTATQLFVFATCLWSADGTIWMWFSLFISILLSTALFTWLVPQLCLVQLPFMQLLRNSLVFMLLRGKRTLLSMFLQLLIWGFVAIYLPYSLVLFPFVAFWAVTLAADLAIYAPLNKDLKVEEQLDKRREEN